MGYSLSWLALQCAVADDALSELGMARTGERCEYARAPLSSQTLPTGWLLVVSTRCDAAFIEPQVLAGLSEKWPLLACSIEEHVMFCCAEHWKDGALVWRVAHDSDKEPVDLSTEGVLPPDLQSMIEAAVMQAAMQQQSAGTAEYDVDYYFEVPLNAAKSLAGFRHDEDVPGIAYDTFSVLNYLDGRYKRKSWWCAGR